MSSESLADSMLLLATAALGLGFGATIMALNSPQCSRYLRVDTFPGADDILILAATVLIDMMVDQGR